MILENFCKILSVNTAGTSGPREPMVRLSRIYLFNRVGHGGEVAKQEETNEHRFHHDADLGRFCEFLTFLLFRVGFGVFNSWIWRVWFGRTK